MSELQRRRELASKTKAELIDIVVDAERTLVELAPEREVRSDTASDAPGTA